MINLEWCRKCMTCSTNFFQFGPLRVNLVQMSKYCSVWASIVVFPAFSGLFGGFRTSSPSLAIAGYFGAISGLFMSFWSLLFLGFFFAFFFPSIFCHFCGDFGWFSFGSQCRPTKPISTWKGPFSVWVCHIPPPPKPDPPPQEGVKMPPPPVHTTTGEGGSATFLKKKLGQRYPMRTGWWGLYTWNSAFFGYYLPNYSSPGLC